MSAGDKVLGCWQGAQSTHLDHALAVPAVAAIQDREAPQRSEDGQAQPRQPGRQAYEDGATTCSSINDSDGSCT
jgi:hypothetical protein